MIAPTLEKFSQEFAGKVVVAKVNTDENSEWASKYGVQGIPTLLFVHGGKVIHRQVGALPEKKAGSRSQGRGNAKSARRRQRQSPPQTPGIAARHRTVRGSPERTKPKGDARRGPAS
jgi:thiol-disulfide isomerase/thioredoxin